MRYENFLWAGCLSLLVSCAPQSTIYLVRHAERANDSDTTSLSTAGLQRAERLSQRLAGLPLDTIFVTPYTRTRQTAAPTARSKGLPLTQYAVKPVTEIADRVRSFRGKSALIVGHSNTVLEIARALGTSPSIREIRHTDYQYLLILRFRSSSSGQPRVTLREDTY